MRHFIVFILLFLGIGYSAPQTPLKILQIVPFGEKNIKITFNREITSKDVKQTRISDLRGVLDIRAILVTKRKNYAFPNGVKVQIAQQTKTTTRILLQGPKKLQYHLGFSEKNLYIQLDSAKSTLHPSSKPQKTKSPNLPKTKAISEIKKQKRIVIDAGHGGKDCGAIGVSKTCEKTIALSVAKLLSSELKSRGYAVYMTRASDFYIGLRERTKFANDKKADLFISIHANSIPKTSRSNANGVETYFLSTARSERAKVVAEQENKDDIEAMNFFLKQTFADSIINNPRLVASNKLAIDIQGGILDALRKKYKVADGGVREGPFWVLAGALMPSVLIEIGYISHPQEGQRISQKAYQKLLVEGIADGIGGYFAKNP